MICGVARPGETGQEAVSLFMFTVTDVLWFINSTIIGAEVVLESQLGKLFVFNIGTLYY